MVDRNGPLPRCATLAIGTLPHRDAAAAVDFMMRHHPECPSWPQLPRADFREGMYVQYTEGMPAAVVDAGERRIFFDTERAPQELADFYESYFAGDMERCRISAGYARGFEPAIQRLPLPSSRFVKGQVTGPASFGLTVTDEHNKPVLYHADLFEAVVKALACKGRWQVERFREAAPDLVPVVFFDEPYLTQVGSALISLSPEQVVANLDECFAAIDGLTGIHVCGGTDWGLLTATQADILHFDAADHWREFLIYEKELAAFMERGGMFGWGIVPTDDRAREGDAAAMAEKILRMAERMAGFGPAGIGVEDILSRSFVSEACGTGTLEMDLAEKCYSLADGVSAILKKQLG